MLVRFILVLVGGGIGTTARYLVALGFARALGDGPAFPWATLAVNVVGCFLIGALIYLGREASRISPLVLLALTTGFMGGFTTYSAYCWETLRFVERGELMSALTYLAATVVTCAAGGALGHAGARRLVPARPLAEAKRGASGGGVP